LQWPVLFIHCSIVLAGSALPPAMFSPAWCYQAPLLMGLKAA
jgi:hypothetical protein